MTRRTHRLSGVLIAVLGVAIPAWLGSTAGCRMLPETTGIPASLHRALVEGDYAQADKLATDQTTRVEADNGAESLALAHALDWLVEARIRNGYAGAPSTLTLAERAVRLKEQHLGSRHPDTALSLHNLATAHLQRGEFSRALPLLQRSLSIRTSTLDSRDSAIADSLDQLGLTLVQLERFGEAERRLTDSRRIRENGSDQSPLLLARTLELIALLHRTRGNYAAALPAIDRALEIRTRVAPRHPDTVFALQIRGDLHLLMGDTPSARRVWSSALELGEKTLRPEHPAIAHVLRRLGFAAFSLGNLSEARGLRERALRIGEHSLAPCDPARAALVNAVGISLENDAEYQEARKVYRKALDTVRSCRDGRDSDLTADEEATLLFNEGEVARRVGDLLEADELHQRATEVWSKGLGPNHPFVAKGLDAEAEVAALRAELPRAQTLYDRALGIRRRSLGAEHPQVAWTLTSLARTVADMGNVPLALQYLDRSLAIYEKSGGADEPDHLARVLELRGLLETRQGRFEAARVSLERAMAERSRIFGESHPLVAETKVALATNDLLRGRSGDALKAALEAERSGRDHLLFTVRYLPERQALFYAAKRPRGLDLALTVLTGKSRTDAAAIFDAVIRSRGVVLDELAARHRATAGAKSDAAPLIADVTAARQRFANLMVRSLQEPVPRATLDGARKEKEDAERVLAERSVAERAELKKPTLGFAEIKAALPARSVLVSFVRFDRAVGVRSSVLDSRHVVASYLAFILRPATDRPVVVPLGSATPIDATIAEWRRQVTQPPALSASSATAEQDVRTVGSHLRNQIWAPIERHIRGSDLIFVVPDGAINLVSFAALPVGATEYWIDRSPAVHYLTTERDLLQLPDAKPADAKGLLALGGPAFDRWTGRADSVANASIDASAQLRTSCGSLQSLQFPPLPGSLKEVQDLVRRWSTTRDGTSPMVDVLTGTTASEAAFKAQAAGHRVLHLATHGFFLGGDCRPSEPSNRSAARTRAAAGLVATSGNNPRVTALENPLLQTGLALAGANRRAQAKPTEEDGILTAEEVASLNLDGVEWAVLSACDTGLGEIKAGEGVFGLRRAFQIAGARTVIMSLWSVEDESTRVWMRALYEGRLQRHLGTTAAMQEASLAVLRDRRAHSQSTHPFYWAAFVAAGDWK